MSGSEVIDVHTPNNTTALATCTPAHYIGVSEDDDEDDELEDEEDEATHLLDLSRRYILICFHIFTILFFYYVFHPSQVRSYMTLR